MKTIVSGIQPTGSLNIGTYLGSIKNFVKLQQKYSDHHFYLFIADLHAMTTPIDAKKLRKKIKELAALYLACGLERDNLSLFIQSEIPAHSQMGYLLQCFTYMGELERMTQYKDKAQKQSEGIRSSLFTYPALMAGDILLYDAEYVPVGDDQKQHLELTRNIAERINQRYGEVFKVPKPLIPKIGARIMSLTDPMRKMSKSDENVKSRINLLDEENIIRKRIKSAVTDSDQTVRYDKQNKPGLSNLFDIRIAITDESVKEIEDAYADKGYKDFKEDLGEIVVNELLPIQKRYRELLDSGELDQILDEGKQRAEKIAAEKIDSLNRILGLGRKRKQKG